jgi:acetyl-CoA carboxylase biotin carboxylase subunit
MFKKILIANRGEIAVRGHSRVPGTGDSNRGRPLGRGSGSPLHVRFADESVCIGPAPAVESYLNIPAIISAAEITGADAIHPGLWVSVGKHPFRGSLRKLPHHVHWSVQRRHS